jgi:hypothetical protein
VAVENVDRHIPPPGHSTFPSIFVVKPGHIPLDIHKMYTSLIKMAVTGVVTKVDDIVN